MCAVSSTGEAVSVAVTSVYSGVPQACGPLRAGAYEVWIAIAESVTFPVSGGL